MSLQSVPLLFLTAVSISAITFSVAALILNFH